MVKNQTFSFSTWLIKITSRAFWVWIITTGIVCGVLWLVLRKDNAEYTWLPILLIIWGLSMVLFIGGNVLIDALSKSVEKASISFNTNINANANTSISASGAGSATSDSGKKQ